MYKNLIKLLDRHKCVLYNTNKIRSQKCTKIKTGRRTQYGEYDEDVCNSRIIRGLNNELKEKGYRVISGKVPTKYFKEKFYGMAVG